jgi:hypothetical protein
MHLCLHCGSTSERSTSYLDCNSPLCLIQNISNSIDVNQGKATTAAKAPPAAPSAEALAAATAAVEAAGGDVAAAATAQGATVRALKADKADAAAIDAAVGVLVAIKSLNQ